MRVLNNEQAERVFKDILESFEESYICECEGCKMQRNIELVAETLENCTDDFIVSFKECRLIVANTKTNTFNKYNSEESSEKMYFIKLGYDIIKEELKKAFDDFENHSKFSDLLEARNRIYHDYENILTK
ncbi:MAG: hypothetical protein ACRCXX_11645 [Cetobacterium sp.]|uniref:hypothetical protein n=1 Tax=Cetobacterium sp. TaxID=2071632 RepID=UPI003F2C4FF2